MSLTSPLYWEILLNSGLTAKIFSYNNPRQNKENHVILHEIVVRHNLKVLNCNVNGVLKQAGTEDGHEFLKSDRGWTLKPDRTQKQCQKRRRRPLCCDWPPTSYRLFSVAIAFPATDRWTQAGRRGASESRARKMKSDARSMILGKVPQLPHL